MIYNALGAVRETLRRHVGANPNGEDIVHVATPAKGVEGQRDCLGITFIALEPEPHMPAPKNAAAALNLNLIFMVYAAFSDYRESLRLLSACLDCFQKTPHLGRGDFPGMALPFDSVFVEPWFCPAERLLTLWNPFDNEASPILFFKLRSITFTTDPTTANPAADFDKTWRT